MDRNQKLFKLLAHPDSIGQGEYRAIYELLECIYCDDGQHVDDNQPPIEVVMDELAEIIVAMRKVMGISSG